MNYIIIEPNQIHYSDMEKTHSRFSKTSLEEDIEDFIQIFSDNNAYDGMQSIVEKCKFSSDDLIHTTVIQETCKYVYYMIHTVNDDNNSSHNINRIAMYLARNKFKIYGSVGIIKEEVLSSGDTAICQMKLSEILQIYQDCLTFTGVKIDENGDVNEIKYILNPIDWLKPEQCSNYKFFEFEIFDKIMMVFIEMIPKNDIFNVKASTILSKKVHGTVFVALRAKIDDIKQIDHIYENLDKETISKLISILQVDQNDVNESANEKQKMKIMNFHIIIDKRYKKLLEKKNTINRINIFEKFKDQTPAHILAAQFVNKKNC